MRRHVYLGVDGGGTKTRFALMDDDGALVGEAQTGTTYHPEVGLDGVARILAGVEPEGLQPLGRLAAYAG